MNYKFLTLLMLAFAISSCGDKSGVESSKVDYSAKISNTPIDSLEVDTTSSDDYQFIPPSPVQIARLFKKAGLDYRGELPYPPENASVPQSKFAQSITFGIYSSDMAYSVMNEQFDAANDILEAIQHLGNQIGLETVFQEQDLAERFRANLGNLDSITSILIYVQEHTDEYVMENGKDELAAIYYAGAWTEGMYLGSKTVMEDTSKNVGLLLAEQIAIAEMIVRGLKNIEDPVDELSDLIDELDEIIDIFNDFESIQAMGDSKNYLDLKVTREEVNLISGKIIELREEITP